MSNFIVFQYKCIEFVYGYCIFSGCCSKILHFFQEKKIRTFSSNILIMFSDLRLIDDWLEQFKHCSFYFRNNFSQFVSLIKCAIGKPNPKQTTYAILLKYYYCYYHQVMADEAAVECALHTLSRRLRIAPAHKIKWTSIKCTEQ